MIVAVMIISFLHTLAQACSGPAVISISSVLTAWNRLVPVAIWNRLTNSKTQFIKSGTTCRLPCTSRCRAEAVMRSIDNAGPTHACASFKDYTLLPLTLSAESPEGATVYPHLLSHTNLNSSGAKYFFKTYSC
jgi:hypothetical protein